MTSRNIYHQPENGDPSGNKVAVDAYRDQLEAICGSAHLAPFSFDSDTFENVVADIPGVRSELVVIGAHIDSTAARDVGYDHRVGPAPGADDDLSGVYGVIAAAELLKALADETPPQYSFRFALFNAEEWNRVGSIAYAQALAEAASAGEGPNVRAMLQMDMIGYRDPTASGPHSFEVHGTGVDDFYEVKDGTDYLANVVAAQAATFDSNLAPQVYPLDGCSSDPATHRSDHSSFHFHDWPAVLVSEDLWSETCDPAVQVGNPHYHKSSDVLEELDLDYLANIARCVAQAAWLVANP